MTFIDFVVFKPLLGWRCFPLVEKCEFVSLLKASKYMQNKKQGSKHRHLFHSKNICPLPLPYFKVNICPFPLPHFASIFFAYL
jgi:hypothetical protein